MAIHWWKSFHRSVSILLIFAVLTQQSPVFPKQYQQHSQDALQTKAGTLSSSSLLSKPESHNTENSFVPISLSTGQNSDTVPFTSIAVPSKSGSEKFTEKSSQTLASQLELITQANSNLSLDEISLQPGWNLISLPKIPPDTDPASVLASITGDFNTVYAYDGCDSNDPYKVYDPAANPADNDLTAIDHSIGLWVQATQAATLPVTGTIPPSTTIQLCQGWNLIGFPVQQARHVRSALASIEGKYSRVFGYDPSDVDDPWEIFDVAAPEWANDLVMMEPGRGYWVLATENTSLTLVNEASSLVVEISSPESSPTELASVTSVTDVIGTVSSSVLQSWTLSYRLSGETTSIPLATGITPVTNASLGSFDPTLLLNGIYAIELTATDYLGQSASASVDVIVEREQKVGLFTLSFMDLDVPVAGLPMQIIRTYDSRDKRVGDFGVGWNLSIENVRLQESTRMGSGWLGTVTGGLFKTYCIQPTRPHIVTITVGDGTVHKFEAFPEPQCQQVLPPEIVTISFRPIAGTTGTLATLDSNDVIVSGTFPGAVELLNPDTLSPYETDTYEFDLIDGSQLNIDQRAGLQKVTDLNGNTLAFTPGGIIHSSGKSVLFTRDAQNRVSQITDPMGNTISYAYDARGDLTSVTDQTGDVTRFTYNSTHGLLDILDPRGVRVSRNEYDSEGRLVANVDADGNRIEYTHDIQGKQEIVRDRRGNLTLYLYDQAGNILSHTDALGKTTSFEYDSRGNQLSKTDPLGNTTKITYDVNNSPLVETDPLGHTLTWIYNANGQPLTLTDHNGHETKFTYDVKGNLKTTVDPLGGMIANTFDNRGNRITTTDQEGHTLHYAYESFGNYTSYTDFEGNTTTYTYDANGNQTSQTITRTGANGNILTETKSWIYDAENRVIQETDSSGHVTKTEYNLIGKMVAIIDNNGNRTEYEYDDRGDLVRTIYPDQTEEIFTYDANHNRISSMDRAGRITTFEYDVLNRRVRTNYPDGSFTRREFDSAGREIALIDENGNRTEFAYDPAWRRVKVTDALGNQTVYAYDANGNRVSMKDANGNATTFEYDANNRLIKTIYPDGTSMAAAYDGAGRTISETDQAGHVTQYGYDALGRLITVTDALGEITNYAYDQVGNLTRQTDANNHTTQFTYDAFGNQIGRQLPLGMDETFNYDPNGNLLSHTDFLGQTISYTYDAENRLIRKVYPDGSQITYTYFPTGQLQAVTDVTGTTSYTYDTRDRLVEVLHADGSQIDYGYDLTGNRTSSTTAAGATDYTYDELHRLSSVTDPAGDVTTYEYDAVGNLTSTTYPNDVRIQYAYDALNRLFQLENLRPDLSVISSYLYTLDPSGNRTHVAEATGRTVDYSYDALYRLIDETITDPILGNQTISYAYDAVGNRLTKTDNGQTINYVYNANDWLTSAGGMNFTYDDNGNTINETGPAGTTNYTYDFENRLISVQNQFADIQFSYDVFGNRVRSIINTVPINYLVDTNASYAQVLEERNDSGNLIASYVYGNDLVSQNRVGITSHYIYDGSGSTRALTDSSSTVTDTYTYDAFGVSLSSIGVTTNNYLYNSEQFDPNVQFYYLRARYYNPAIGRFVTADPFPGSNFSPVSLHRYLYAGANPSNRADPSGLFAMSVGFTFNMASVSLERVNLDKQTLAQGTTVASQAKLVALVLATYAITRCATEAIVSKYTFIGSGRRCDVTNKSIFYPGEDTKETTQHIREAISDHLQWANLTRGPHDFHDLERSLGLASRGWYRNEPECQRGPDSGQDCDEYPFYSTAEGGAAAQPPVSLKLVESSDNRRNGGFLGWFYFFCRINVGDPFRESFGVVPTWDVETDYSCK